jgi:DNA-binding transcriptional LysR family regulator
MIDKSNYLILEPVRQDKGASFLEKFAVEEDLKNESLRSVCILEGSLTIEFGIGYLQRSYLSPAVWAFLRLLDKQKDILATPK